LLAGASGVDDGCDDKSAWRWKWYYTDNGVVL
jgi:hypothetical protein